MSVSLIDTHAHLNDPKFASDIDEVIARANAAGVDRIIVCGYDVESSREAVALAGRFACVYATVGVHPHDAKNWVQEHPGSLPPQGGEGRGGVANEEHPGSLPPQGGEGRGGVANEEHPDLVEGRSEAEEIIADLARNPKVLAIGEIGLDFHYDFSPREAQFAAFRAQIDLAAKLGLPIVVHSRESNEEALEVLRERAGNVTGCVFHCFSGDEDFARRVLEMGFYIGVDGPVTYKASEKLRRVIDICPMDRLLVETDCPYLTPIPYRGKRNEPAYVRYVAEEVARVKALTVEQVAEATSRNASRLFRQIKN